MAQGDPTIGVIQTVTDETNIIKDVSEAIDFLSPWDTPFLDLIGRDSLSDAAEQVKHEWLEDQLIGAGARALSPRLRGPHDHDPIGRFRQQGLALQNGIPCI